MDAEVRRGVSAPILLDVEESLLKAARTNDAQLLSDLLAARRAGRLVLSLNCKGKKKGTRGWTGLHLAAYFGNESVAELLLEDGADPNVPNDDGDTPMHKAALTGRKNLVSLLLKYDTNIDAINGEGQTALQVARDHDTKALLEGAKQAAEKIREIAFLRACKDGDLALMRNLLDHNSSGVNVSINCVDRLGNTALHSAAYLDNRAVAIFLLENGIDTTIRNNAGRLASDLAVNPAMKEMLGVQPIKSLSKVPFRYQGPLFRHQRFRGWRPIWVVLDRGVISYYRSQGNAAANVKRRFYKHLNSAVVRKAPEDSGIFVVEFCDGDVHRLTLTPYVRQRAVERQKWLSVLAEHIDFSTRMLSASVEDDDDDLDSESSIDADAKSRQSVSLLYADSQSSSRMKSLGTMKDTLQTAEAYKELLNQDVESLTSAYQQLPINYRQGALYSVLLKVDNVQRTAKDVIESLDYCLNLFRQQEDLRVLELKRYKEKCRVLEESLLVLAKQHHNLELSLSTGVTRDFGAHPPLPTPRSGTKRKRMSGVVGVVGYIDHSMHSLESSFADVEDLDQDFNTSESEYTTPYGSMTDLREAVPSPVHDFDELCPIGEESENHQSDCDEVEVMDEEMAVIVERSEYGRLSLPSEMPEKDVFNLWSILKSCIGKDLSKITMPVVWNEPLSILQRFAESLEYSDLLEIAANQDDPIARMEYVAAFAVSALSGNWDRLMKPFNPLLGETYELERNNFRMVCEQVSHHPPISAYHVEHALYTFTGTTLPKLKFWGKSVEIVPKGVMTLYFKERNEYYTWSNPPCCVHNIIVGKLWLEQYGNLDIENHSNGYRCSLNFKSAGWFSKNLHAIEGFILDAEKKKQKYLYGRWVDVMKSTGVQEYEEYARTHEHKFSWFSGFHWPNIFGHDDTRSERDHPPPTSPMKEKHRDEDAVGSKEGHPKKSGRKMLSKLNSLTSSEDRAESEIPGDDVDQAKADIPKFPSALSLDIPGSEVLWEVKPRPSRSEKYYNFSAFAMSLNELDPGMESRLCRTDSRLRPDIRKLEQGLLDAAAAEKHRLEEKQREARKSRKKGKGKEWKPRWFALSKNPANGAEDWVYTGGFWDEEKRQELASVDIF